MHIKQKLQ